MTWIDSNGEVRPQSWEEYCEMVKNAPDWPTTQSLMRRFGVRSRIERSHQRSLRKRGERLPPMRVRLFRADPHCFWCGVVTALADSNYNQPDLATVDHLYSKFHPQRRSKHASKTDVLHVLACRECNQERALAELRRQVFIPKLEERREHARLADATLARQYSLKSTEPVACYPMRVIQTLEEAIAFAREPER